MEYIAKVQCMGAKLIAQAKQGCDYGSIVEIVVREPTEALPPCTHRYKYRLFFDLPGECMVRYDNERGKGDHRHADGMEVTSVYALAKAAGRNCSNVHADIARLVEPGLVARTDEKMVKVQFDGVEIHMDLARAR